MSGLSDRRRNLGPSDLVSFEYERADAKEVKKESGELRPVFISQGIAAHAAGSSYMEVGDIKLHATVHGPQQLRGEFNHQAEIEVNVNVEKFAGLGRSDDVSQALSDFIRSSITPAIILKEYPKSRIVISLAILSGTFGGPQMAAAVNVVIMALVNAGIALHDMVTAVAVSKIEDGPVYVDADFDDDTPNMSQIVAASSVSTGKLVSMLVTSQGSVEMSDLRSLISRAGTAAKQLRALFDAFLVEDYSRIAKSN